MRQSAEWLQARIDEVLAPMDVRRRATIIALVERDDRSSEVSAEARLASYLESRSLDWRAADRMPRASRTVALAACELLLRVDPMFDQDRPSSKQLVGAASLWVSSFVTRAVYWTSFSQSRMSSKPSDLLIGAIAIHHKDIELGIYAVADGLVGMFVVAEDS